MTDPIRWPCKVAAIVAVIAGVFLLLGGGGHLSAVLASRAGQAFDFRFVSLLTTSGILIFPGVVAIATSYWLWRGAGWAYVFCLLSALALMLYLSLLVYMKLQVQDDSLRAGPEVYFMTAIAAVYIAVLASVFLWLHGRRGHRLSPA